MRIDQQHKENISSRKENVCFQKGKTERILEMISYLQYHWKITYQEYDDCYNAMSSIKQKTFYKIKSCFDPIKYIYQEIM